MANVRLAGLSSQREERLRGEAPLSIMLASDHLYLTFALKALIF